MGSNEKLNFWRRLGKSAMLYGWLSTAVRAGAQLFLLPVVLTVLSPQELNAWWLFLALGALVVLADFGFGQAFLRVYSYLWAGAADFDTEGLRPPPEHGEPNLPGLRQLHAAATWLYRAVAGGATLVIALAGTWFLLRHIEATAQPAWNWLAWGAYVLAIGYNLATSVWGVACQGINRVRDYQRASLGSSLVYFVLAASLLWAGWGLMAMVVATAVRGVLTRWFCRRACAEVVGTAQTGAEMAILKRLWPNARRFGLTFLGAYLGGNANILIGSLILPTDVMASFGLTVQVGFFAAGLANLWLSVKWPEITILRTQGKDREMAELFARRLGLTLGTFLLLAALVVLAGNPLLAWKGTHTRLLPTPQLVYYLGYLLFQITYGAFGAFTCTANVMPFHRVALLTGLGLVTLSLLLAPVYGLWGMLIGPVFAEVAGNFWFNLQQGWRRQPLRLREFLGAMLLRRARF